MTYKHNLSKEKEGKVITSLEWRTAMAEILRSSFRLGKISSLISRRILIQKYSSKFKRGQDLILSRQKRMFLLRSIFSSSMVHENHSASHSPSSVSTSPRFWFTMWTKDIAVSWASSPTVTFSLDELLIFGLQFWVWFFPLLQRGNPFFPFHKRRACSTHFTTLCNFQNSSNLFTSWRVQKKILFNLIIPK